jgi:hypothetical protein
MTDLGFGFADRRSVVIVLFTFLLSTVLFKNPVPIDLSTPLAAFVSVALVTGAIYLARTLLRIPLVLFGGLLSVPFNMIYYLKEGIPPTRREMAKLFLGVTRDTFWMAYASLFKNQEWHWGADTYFGNETLIGLLGVFDRAALVALAYIATLPSMPQTVQTSGVIGIAFLMVVYVVTGRFSFILKDALHKSEEEQAAQLNATKNPNITFPSSIYTEPKPRNYG